MHTAKQNLKNDNSAISEGRANIFKHLKKGYIRDNSFIAVFQGAKDILRCILYLLSLRVHMKLFQKHSLFVRAQIRNVQCPKNRLIFKFTMFEI